MLVVLGLLYVGVRSERKAGALVTNKQMA